MDQKPDENPYASPAVESVLDRPKVSLGAAAYRGARIGALSGVALVVGTCFVIVVVILVRAIVAERRVAGGFSRVIDKAAESFFPDLSVFDFIAFFSYVLAVFAGFGAIIGAILSMILAWSRRNSPTRS